MSQASAADPQLPAEPDDPVLILYTSGTTGALKAVVHTQASYAAICANILANLVSPGPDSVMLHAASLIHASGTFVLPYWVRGGAAAVLPGFDPGSYLDSLARHRATEINLVPTMLGMLLSSGAGRARRRLAACGRRCTARARCRARSWSRPSTSGARDSCSTTGRPRPRWRSPCWTPPTTPTRRWPVRAGSPRVDAEVRVTDEDGTPLPAGEVGELRLRAPFAMAGYHDAPELTAETLDADGWVRTRDLARFDDRGYLTLVDRTSDMIITGGYNVYPREVEDVLMAHPAVAGAAVVGAPDPTWVEAVTAFVTLRPGAEVDRRRTAGRRPHAPSPATRRPRPCTSSTAAAVPGRQGAAPRAARAAVGGEGRRS